MILEKTKAFRAVMIGIGFMAFATTLTQLFIIDLRIPWLTYIVGFVEGFSTICVSVPCYDYGVEITYPLGESYSSGLLNIVCNILTLILTQLCSYMIA